MTKRLGIFGPYPPPYGGIATHIQRMEYHLQKEGIPYVIYNHGYTEIPPNVIATRKNPLRYLKMLFLRNIKAMHFHQFFRFHFFYYFFYSLIRNNKLIITLHSERLLNYYPSYQTKLFLFFLKHTRNKIIISVSKKLNDFLNQQGIPSLFIPAYVPIEPNAQKKLVLPENKVKIVFNMPAFTPELAEEVYNAPLAFALVRDMDAHMTFFIGSETKTDKKYLDDMLKRYKINNKVLILYEEPLVNYLPLFDVLIRTNTTDGFGVSLSEAMDAGIPAIASDVCVRPEGTILFNAGSLENLKQKTEEVLTSKNKINFKNYKRNHHLQLLEIYKKVLNDQPINIF